MPLKGFKPTSAALRFRQVPDFSDLTKKKKPEKALTTAKKRMAGRNMQGKVTTRHRGGGEKTRYRIIDFKRDKDGVPARVAAIEYDPNRSARIALLSYRDGEKRYILAPDRLAIGEVIVSGEGADVKVGNALPLRNIPVGTVLHAVELRPGGGAKIARSAGTSGQLLAEEGKHPHLRMPSG